MLMNPSLDEPTSALDPKSVDVLLGALKKGWQDHIILLISHDLKWWEAADISARAMLIALRPSSTTAPRQQCLCLSGCFSQLYLAKHP